MSNVIREIYTKALLARGKKESILKCSINIEKNCTSILGCWIINHQHHARIENEDAKVTGIYDVHLWYSYDYIYSAIEVTKIEYDEIIDLEKIDNKKISVSDQALSECLEEPKCLKATLVNEHEVMLELQKNIGVNIVGETMIKIEMKDIDDEINSINPDFIK